MQSAPQNYVAHCDVHDLRRLHVLQGGRSRNQLLFQARAQLALTPAARTYAAGSVISPAIHKANGLLARDERGKAIPAVLAVPGALGHLRNLLKLFVRNLAAAFATRLKESYYTGSKITMQ